MPMTDDSLQNRAAPARRILRMKKSARRQAAFAVVCLVAVFAPGRCALALEVSEYQAKAVYLYNFISFFQWPSAPDEPFVLGIVGKDRFGDSFADVENKPVKSTGRLLVIKRLGPYRPGMSLRGCNLLFISASERAQAKKIIQSVDGLPVLTVSEFSGFVDGGGMINLVMKQSRLRWEINRDALDRSGLTFHSMILHSAVRIVTQEKGG